MKTITAIALLLLTCACSHTPPPPRVPPPWTEVPAVISEAVCQRARAEGISQGSPIAVLRTTSPIANGSALDALSHAYGARFGGSTQLAGKIGGSTAEMPILLPVPGNGSCNFHPIDAVDQERVTDVMLLQMSIPMLNPFEKKESGLFARLSIGGHDATWYWIPVAEKKGQWLIGNVVPLALHEN